MVYTHKLAVFAFDDDRHFAILQSSLHEIRARKHSSTMRIDLNYSPSDCFETFLFAFRAAAEAARLSELGGAYHEHRRQSMLARQVGLTRLYNLVHTPNCRDGDIAEMRRLHTAMDAAVLAAYGWTDINLAHDFYGEGPDTRFTIAPDARTAILRRLLELNHQRAAEEKAGET